MEMSNDLIRAMHRRFGKWPASADTLTREIPNFDMHLLQALEAESVVLKNVSNMYSLREDIMRKSFVELEAFLGNALEVKEVEHVFEKQSVDELKFVNFSPLTLERYALKLQEGFDAIGGHVQCQTVIKGKPEFNEALKTVCDACIIQIHGSENEDPITDIRLFPGHFRIVLVHRPEEYILRRGTAGLEFLNSVADVVVLLGKCMVNHYKRLLGRKETVVAIPHGFFDTGFEREERKSELLVVGSITTWGEMRHLQDLVELHEKVKQCSPHPEKVLGYAGGKFDNRVRWSENVFFQLENSVAEAALEKGDFFDADSFAGWVLQQSSGKPVIHLKPFEKGSKLEKWEAVMIDFNLQAYREILKNDLPKVEASGTLHLAGGPGVYVVIDCPAMRDIVEDEGAEYVFLPVKDDNSFDFDSAAEAIVKIAADSSEHKRIVAKNIEACSAVSMKAAAQKYVDLLEKSGTE
jgi:hypothetical protein